MTAISYVSNTTELVKQGAKAEETKPDTAKALSEEKQIFLEILLTQLENQNPLDPVDTTEFTNQLVAYSSLEQEMEINQNLESIAAALDSANALSAVSYLGSNVDVDSPTSVMQDGEVRWSYALENDAENVTLQIVNSDGEVLAAYGAEGSAAGTYDIVVANADLASEVAEGTPLKLVVVAVDSAGEMIGTDIVGTVDVDGVETSDDGVTLTAGSVSFSADDVVSLRMKKNSSVNAA